MVPSHPGLRESRDGSTPSPSHGEAFGDIIPGTDEFPLRGTTPGEVVEGFTHDAKKDIEERVSRLIEETSPEL